MSILAKENNLCTMILSKENQSKIKNIDKLTLDLIGMLELYGDTKNLPWSYVEKRGVFNIISQYEEVKKLDPQFKAWIIKQRSHVQGKSAKSFDMSELDLNQQIELAQTLEKTTRKTLKGISCFTSVDTHINIKTINKLECLNEETWYVVPDAVKTTTNSNYFKIRHKSYYDNSWSTSDWLQDKSEYEKALAKHDKAHSNDDYYHLQICYHSGPITYNLEWLPDEFKGFDERFFVVKHREYDAPEYLDAVEQAKAIYANKMIQYQEDLEFYEKHKNMLDHAPAHPQMAFVTPVILLDWYLELTELGKQVYNYIQTKISKIQQNNYDGCKYAESEFSELEKRPNYREALDPYIGQTINLVCDSFSISEENGHKTLIGRNISIVDNEGNKINNSEINHMYFFVDDNVQIYQMTSKLHITGIVKRYKYNEQVNIGLVPQTLWFNFQ